MARRGKFEYWLTEDGLTLLEGWARDGLTDEQIAHNAGITATTLYEWKNRFPKISEALKKGKEVVDYDVENALLNKALAGDTTAQIFWLKNRMPDKWQEKPDAGKLSLLRLDEALGELKNGIEQETE